MPTQPPIYQDFQTILYPDGTSALQEWSLFCEGRRRAAEQSPKEKTDDSR